MVYGTNYAPLVLHLNINLNLNLNRRKKTIPSLLLHPSLSRILARMEGSIHRIQWMTALLLRVGTPCCDQSYAQDAFPTCLPGASHPNPSSYQNGNILARSEKCTFGLLEIQCELCFSPEAFLPHPEKEFVIFSTQAPSLCQKHSLLLTQFCENGPNLHQRSCL